MMSKLEETLPKFSSLRHALNQGRILIGASAIDFDIDVALSDTGSGTTYLSLVDAAGKRTKRHVLVVGGLRRGACRAKEPGRPSGSPELLPVFGEVLRTLHTASWAWFDAAALPMRPLGARLSIQVHGLERPPSGIDCLLRPGVLPTVSPFRDSIVLSAAWNAADHAERLAAEVVFDSHGWSARLDTEAGPGRLDPLALHDALRHIRSEVSDGPIRRWLKQFSFSFSAERPSAHEVASAASRNAH